MYEGQSAMPHLPVPALEQTLKKYLRSTVPHQSKESLAKTEQAVQSALSGADAKLVQTLQQRLEDRATKEGRESWLSEWWNDAATWPTATPSCPTSATFTRTRTTRRAAPAPSAPPVCSRPSSPSAGCSRPNSSRPKRARRARCA